LEQSENSLQTHVFAAGLSGFSTHKQANSLPWNITITNDDKEGNLATKTAIRRTVMQVKDFQV